MSTSPNPEFDPSSPAMLGIFSTGRSGSTWLGCLFDSHPDVTYRFEPHAKTRGLSSAAKEAIARLADAGLSDSDLPTIRSGLLHSNPYTDKPPFFQKSPGALRMDGLRQALCPLARKVPMTRPVYQRLFTPRVETTLVFKYVAHERQCSRAILQTSMKVVYLVRHPCGVVGSLLKGQEQGKMPSGRRSVVGQFLKDHTPTLHDRHAHQLESMSPAQLEALLWRCSVEWAFGVNRFPRQGVHLVFYENLCRNPGDELHPMLRLAGLEMHSNVEGFVAASTSGEQRRFSELGIGRYFSVFRDPEASMNRWKETLSASDRSSIFEIVADAPMFKWGVEEAGWDH